MMFLFYFSKSLRKRPSKKIPYLWLTDNFYAEKAKEKNCRGLNNKEFYYFYLMHPQYRAMSISHSPFIYLILQMDFFCLRICRAYIFMCLAFCFVYIYFYAQEKSKMMMMIWIFFGTLYCACCLLFHSLLNDFILTSYKKNLLFVVGHFFGYLFEVCCDSCGWRHLLYGSMGFFGRSR